jgi:hypothetical protein
VNRQLAVQMIGVGDLLHEVLNQPADAASKDQHRHPFGGQLL